MKLPANFWAILSAISAVIITVESFLGILNNIGVHPTLPSGQLPFGLVLAFVGVTALPLWIGYQLYPRLHRRATHDLTKILQSLENDGEMWLLGYDHDTWAKHNPEVIKSAVKNRLVVRILRSDANR